MVFKYVFKPDLFRFDCSSLLTIPALQVVREVSDGLESVQKAKHKQVAEADLRNRSRYSILVSLIAFIETAVPGNCRGAKRLLQGIRRATESED
jgi:hypothetical protein